MLFFVDESGTDHRDSPYEVLAGIAVQERDLWNLIQSIQEAEKEFFKVRLSEIRVEFKGKSLLKKKVFEFAQQGPELPVDKRSELAFQFLTKGRDLAEGRPTGAQTREEYTAYGQAVLAFVDKIFDLCALFRVKCFASIIDPNAPRPMEGNFLRKDYAYLFERFFYFLEDYSPTEIGVVVFDELEKARCRILIDQMTRYFLRTAKGKIRSARILPEPFFVHSDLTTAVQLADIVAYCLNWGFRFPWMTKPPRLEMKRYGQQVFDLRYVGKRFDQRDGREWPIYGLTYLDDLRAKTQREDELG